MVMVRSFVLTKSNIQVKLHYCKPKQSHILNFTNLPFHLSCNHRHPSVDTSRKHIKNCLSLSLYISFQYHIMSIWPVLVWYLAALRVRTLEKTESVQLLCFEYNLKQKEKTIINFNSQ